ncbi:MAG: hypothetical protein ACTSR1_02605 [Candidatus Heimdallarchaeota archaeon]
MILITDATLLIAIFDERELGEPAILEKILSMGYELLIPSAVGKEVRRYQEHGLEIDQFESSIPFKKEWFPQQTSNYQLGEGEIEVIAYGLYMKNINEEYLCLLDDKKARTIASNLGLKIIGTLGIIDKLFLEGLLTKEESQLCLKKLEKSKFRVPSKAIKERLDNLSIDD